MRSLVKILFVLLPLSGFGQQLVFNAHEATASLSELQITGLYRLPNSYILLGTNDGLYTYDGSSLEQLSNLENHSNRVSAALIEEHLQLIGYSDGSIYFLRNNELELWLPSLNLPESPIQSIVKDDLDRIWVATYGSGLFLYDGVDILPVQGIQSEIENDIYDLSAGPDNTIFYGTDQGLFSCFLRDKRETHWEVEVLQLTKFQIVTALLMDSIKNGSWVTTYENGLFFYDWNSREIKSIINPKERIQSQIRISENQLILLLDQEEPLKFLNTLNYEIVRPGHTGTDFPLQPTQLLFDSNRSLWIWCEENGLLSTSPDFELYTTDVTDIQAVASRDTVTLLGSDQGLFRFRKNGPSEILVDGENILKIIFPSSGDEVWCATMGSGILIYNLINGNTQWINSSDGLINDHVLSLHQSDSEIIAATLGGVSVIDSYSHEMKDEKSDLIPQSQYVYDVLVDQNSNIWLGKDGRGAVRINPRGEVSHILEEETVFSIRQSQDGEIWLATAENGIFSMESGSLLSADSMKVQNQIPLPTNGMALDIFDNLIVLTEFGLKARHKDQKGLVPFGPKYLSRKMKPHINGFYTDNQKNIWFASGNQLLKYRPIGAIKSQPELVINKATIGSKFLIEDSTIAVNYQQNSLELQFTGIWFNDPSLIKYRYKLQGLNDNWVSTKNKLIIYPKLQPGDYHFMLEASLDDEFDNASTFQTSFTINPPFWNRLDFRIGVVILGLGLIYFITQSISKRRRKYDLLETERVRSELETLKSQIDPHFLFNNFNNILSLIEEDVKTAEKYTESLSDFYRSILKYRNTDLISLEEEIQVFNNYLFLLRIQFGNNIHVTINGSVNGNKKIVPLTLQILLENCLKHNTASSQKPLRVTIDINEKSLEICNNIQLKNTAPDSTNFGLNALEIRYKILTKNSLQIRQNNNNFCVTVPIITNGHA